MHKSSLSLVVALLSCSQFWGTSRGQQPAVLVKSELDGAAHIPASSFRFYVAPLPATWTTPFDVDTEISYGYKSLGEMDTRQKASEDSPFWLSHWSRFYPLWLHALLTSPLRVHDPAHADAIFVPLCLGYCHGHTHAPKALESTTEVPFFGNATALLPLLRSKPHFMVVNGRLPRHWFETWPGWRDNMRHFVLISQDNEGFENVVGAPAPSHEHFSVASKYFHKAPAHAVVGPKSLLLLATYPPLNDSQGTQGALHHQLITQCLARPLDCRYRPPQRHGGTRDHNKAYALHYNATYALAPTGNWQSISELYDAIVGTSVPVVFGSRLTHHAAFSDVLDYSRFVVKLTREEISQQHIVDALAQPAVVAKLHRRQEALYRVRHAFQYMNPAAHLLVRFDRRSELRPLDDAFTFTLKALLRHLCRRGLVPAARCPAVEGRGGGAEGVGRGGGPGAGGAAGGA